MASARLLDDGEHGVAAGEIDVADIDQDADAAGDAVDRAGKDLADADGADGIDRSGALSGGFHRQRDLGGGQKGIAAIGHEHRAGVAAFAFDLESQGGGRGDCGDDAERDAGAFEQRALLDVQFDEGVIVIAGQRDRRPAGRRSRPRCGPRRGWRHHRRGARRRARRRECRPASGCRDSRCRSAWVPRT